MASVIEVYEVEIDDIIRWKFRIRTDVGTVTGHSTYASRHDAVEAARQNPANAQLEVNDVDTPDRP